MRRVAPAVTFVAVAAAWPCTGWADEKQQCVTASEQGQQLRDDGKYRRAREAFTSCARPSCPTLVQSDCVKWLADLEASSPSVVIVAKDDKGNDLTAVTVKVDGAPLVTMLDGRPVLVDPGEHQFHYESPGFPPVEAHVVVHAGEKSRPLTVQFGTPRAPEPVPPPAKRERGEEAPPAAPPAESVLPTIGWISIGVGAVSLIGAGVSFAVRQSALNDAQNLCGTSFTSCPPNNDAVQSDANRGRTASTLVTVFGIVGAVGIAGGIVLLVAGNGHPQQSRLIISPTLGGASAAWRF